MWSDWPLNSNQKHMRAARQKKKTLESTLRKKRDEYGAISVQYWPISETVTAIGMKIKVKHNEKRSDWDEWERARYAANFSVFPAVVCVNAFEKKWVEKEICYFWFFLKKYRIFSMQFNIKRKYKWIGKRWQWIWCESYRFSSENWPQKKYVVLKFFFCMLLLLFYYCFSCCVLLAYTTYFNAHYIRCYFAPFVRGSSLKRVIVKTMLKKNFVHLQTIEKFYIFSLKFALIWLRKIEF